MVLVPLGPTAPGRLSHSSSCNPLSAASLPLQVAGPQPVMNGVRGEALAPLAPVRAPLQCVTPRHPQQHLLRTHLPLAASPLDALRSPPKHTACTKCFLQALLLGKPTPRQWKTHRHYTRAVWVKYLLVGNRNRLENRQNIRWIS